MTPRSRSIPVAIAIFTLAAAPRAGQSPAAASVRTWVSHEAQMEAHLRTAAVTRFENADTGVTRPRIAYLTPATPFDRLIWKVIPPGRHNGHWDSYQSEIAAYLLDRRLQMHMVPPAVERKIDGDVGAAVMWIDGAPSVKDSGGQVPSAPIWGRDLRRMQMFDNFIGNVDRNAGNILLGPPGEIVLIDHSRAFVDDRSLPFPFERVDGPLWTRMQALTRADLDKTIGAWVDSRAIGAMLDRRQRMAEIVDKLVKQKPRALVIVP